MKNLHKKIKDSIEEVNKYGDKSFYYFENNKLIRISNHLPSSTWLNKKNENIDEFMFIIISDDNNMFRKLDKFNDDLGIGNMFDGYKDIIIDDYLVSYSELDYEHLYMMVDRFLK